MFAPLFLTTCITHEALMEALIAKLVLIHCSKYCMHAVFIDHTFSALLTLHNAVNTLQDSLVTCLNGYTMLVKEFSQVEGPVLPL